MVENIGGWSTVKAMRKSGIQEDSDDRIFSSRDFVSKVINHAEEKIKYQMSAEDLKKRIRKKIENHCFKEKIFYDQLRSGSRLMYDKRQQALSGASNGEFSILHFDP